MPIREGDQYYVFWLYILVLEENQKGRSSDKPLLGPKIPPKPFEGKILMQKWLIFQILISLLMPFLEWDKYYIFSCILYPVWRESEGMLIKSTSFKFPGGPHDIPEAILMQKW